jgi:hypothetical protein
MLYIFYNSQARGVLLLTTVALYILVGIVGNCAIFVILSRVFSYETAKSCAWVFIKLYPIRKGLFVVSGVLALMTSVVRTAGEDRDLSTNKKNE